VKLPPPKLNRIYARDDKDKTGDFVIYAEPLPADISARMTEAEHIARCEVVRKAIDAEWLKIRGSERQGTDITGEK
jgi:hypothetical protein